MGVGPVPGDVGASESFVEGIEGEGIERFAAKGGA
jgi:hypothetical protein